MPMPQAYFFRPYDSKSVRAMRYALGAPYPHQGPFVATEQSLAATTSKPGSALSDVPVDVPREASPRQQSSSRASSSAGHPAPFLTDNSVSTPEDGGSFECSSGAPYWIPDDIKHYFVHRHSLAGMGRDANSRSSSSSRRTDWALREIGRERELPTDDGNSWSRWTVQCFGTGRNAAVACVTTAAVLILVLVLMVLVADQSRTESGVPAALGSRKDEPAVTHHSEFLLPLPKDDLDKDYPDRDERDNAPNKAEENENDPDEIIGNDGRSDTIASGKMPAKGKGASATADAVEEPDAPARSSLYKPVLAPCGSAVFAQCVSGKAEFYHSGSVNACVAIGVDRTGLCARGRNRFSSMASCRRKCVDSSNGAAPECYQRAIFEECQSRDILKTWWYSDGRSCRRWHFPRGLCPSNGGHVFQTSAECARKCDDKRRPCRVPKTVHCNATYLRFAYFADASTKRSRTRRCRRVAAAGADRAHLCLTGANRFRTVSACRKRCNDSPQL